MGDDSAPRVAEAKERSAGVDQALVDAVCARLCRYFKPEKVEDERCGGWERLRRDLRSGRLPEGWREALEGRGRASALKRDELLSSCVCDACPFRVDGCDYRDPAGPSDAQPCGGVVALDLLLAAGVLSNEDLLSDREG